jgi:hypothetical protein
VTAVPATMSQLRGIRVHGRFAPWRRFSVEHLQTYTLVMPGEPADSVIPPGELRPAQLGIVALGRVVLGHLSATLADLAERGFLRIEEIPRGDDPDWLLTDLRDTAPGQGGLLRFEATLLDGLLSQRQVRLSALGQDLIPVLGKVRAQLRQDAVRAGRLRSFRREQRTARGERLLEEIHGFRRGLRALAASGGPGALAELAPYAMVFGLPVPATVSLATDSAGTRQRRFPDVPWSSFARGWQQTCERQFEHSRGTAHRPASRDFAHQWSAPHNHDHDSASHGHGGYDSGHGGYGGHSGGFSGGHAGH